MKEPYFERREVGAFALEPLEDANQGTFKVWYQDAGHFRIESTTTKVTLTPETQIAAADGTRYFNYNGQDNTLSTDRLPPAALPKGEPPSIHGVGMRSTRFAIDVDSLVAEMNTASGGIPRWARATGNDVWLGVPVVLVEFGPTWANSEKNTYGGTGRMWIEQSSMFVLKQTTEGNDGSTASESVVTRFARNEEAPSNIFKLKPPQGAATATPYQTPAQQDPAAVQRFFERDRDGRGIPGFYVFTVPGVLTSAGGGFEPQNDGYRVITNKLEDPVGAVSTVIEIEQRRRTGPLPPNVTLGTKLKIRGHAGYVFSRGERVYFSWSDGEIAVLLTATGLSEDEVKAMALSIRPAAP